MADRLVTIARFAYSSEAELAKQFLADFGIDAVITGQHAADLYAGVTAIAAAELQVLESEAQKACEILNSHKKQE